MSGRTIAPEGPAADSGQKDTVASVIPETMPSPIDEAAEQLDIPDTVAALDAAAGETSPVEAPTVEQHGTPGEAAPTVDTLLAQIDAMKEDVSTLNLIRDDPEAARMLSDHFEGKTRGAGTLPTATGDNVEHDGSNDPRVDQLFNAVENLTRQFTQDRAQRALTEFKGENPVVKDPRVATAMQNVLKEPGCEALSLHNVLTIALSKLGMVGKTGGKAPLQPSESGGAPRSDITGSEDAIQQRIDSQDSFEQGLKVALQETAKQQGFQF